MQREKQTDDLVSRQAAIDAIKALYEWHDTVTEDRTIDHLKRLPSAQPDNQTNLCDSCNYSYPDCPSKNDDVIFGNGVGNDNICACNKYKPSAHPEIIRCKDCKYGDTFHEIHDPEMPMMCIGHHYGWIYPDDFCRYAERRTDD